MGPTERRKPSKGSFNVRGGWSPANDTVLVSVRSAVAKKRLIAIYMIFWARFLIAVLRASPKIALDEIRYPSLPIIACDVARHATRMGRHHHPIAAHKIEVIGVSNSDFASLSA